MKLKNILLTIPLALSISCATIPKDNDIKNAGMLIQNASLIYEDQYVYTRYGLDNYGAIEGNPIAKFFLDRRMDDLWYATSIGATITGNLIANKIDKKGNLAKVINGSIALMEVWCIQRNSRLLTPWGFKENTINKNRYVEVFRWSY